MRIKCFEEIEAWKTGRELAALVFSLTDDEPLAHRFGLRDQMERSAVSAMSNIAEGFECGSKKSFVRYLYIAKGSAAELRSQLYVARDAGLIGEQAFLEAYRLSQIIGRQLFGFIRYLKKTLAQ